MIAAPPTVISAFLLPRLQCSASEPPLQSCIRNPAQEDLVRFFTCAWIMDSLRKLRLYLIRFSIDFHFIFERTAARN
ncbi:MAG: hypothetical protein A3I66_18160 [Burkholderiales bacterium RIFCSPLOWO2_02_FULL_57_36]|nr:MAG: hypothetical protein A3I66_18160 [Burkholderiales bacterium RIFCSPLOWO2_02_FULL_57_36]